MIAEGSSSETPGGEPPRPTERDLLAERRARRAALSGDLALVHRAEVAEATVQTLETHLSSLQQRLQEAEDERGRSTERLAASENELRRVKQQEYAEQQLRVEAERALTIATDRSADGALARSEVVQRLQARVAEVERRAERLAEEIESERRAREHTERALEAMRESHATMAATVGELRDVARRLRDAAANSPSGIVDVPVSMPPAPSEPPNQARREEMAGALAAAVERLRARAEESSLSAQEPEGMPTVGASTVGASTTGAPRAGESTSEALLTGAAPMAKPKPHKHSLSLIGRWRAARKHRRDARRAAAGSPNITKHR